MSRTSAARSLGGYRAAETRRERDEFAAANIPDDLIPLWNKTKLNFRGSPEKRAEKFIAYAHDHENESLDATIDEADRKLEAMIRARERSGGFVSIETLVIGLGLAAVGYVVWRILRKPAAPTPQHAPAPPPPQPPQQHVTQGHIIGPYYEWESPLPWWYQHTLTTT